MTVIAKPRPYSYDCLMEPVIYSADIRRIRVDADSWTEKLRFSWPERVKKVCSYRVEEDRLRCLAAGLLLDAVFGGAGPGEEGLRYSEAGKPYYEEGPHFSLSHSGDYVLLAAGDYLVGIDIEKWAEKDFIALARRGFHPREVSLIEKTPTAQTFFDIWVLKESYIKMQEPPPPGGTSSFFSLPGGLSAVCSDPSVNLRLYRQFPGYSIGLCSPHRGWPDGITEMF